MSLIHLIQSAEDVKDLSQAKRLIVQLRGQIIDNKVNRNAILDEAIQAIWAQVGSGTNALWAGDAEYAIKTLKDPIP